MSPPPTPPPVHHGPGGGFGWGGWRNSVPSEVWASAFADEYARVMQPFVVPKPTIKDAPICAELPSATAAYRLVKGDWSALPDVVVTTLGRAVLIGIGAAFFPDRSHIVRNSIMGALGVEAFVLSYAYIKTRDTKGPTS